MLTTMVGDRVSCHLLRTSFAEGSVLTRRAFCFCQPKYFLSLVICCPWVEAGIYRDFLHTESLWIFRGLKWYVWPPNVHYLILLRYCVVWQPVQKRHNGLLLIGPHGGFLCCCFFVICDGFCSFDFLVENVYGTNFVSHCRMYVVPWLAS